MIKYTQFSSVYSQKPRGFTLLVALIFTAVILSVSLSLADVSYKQLILASTARESEYAFYNADSALECALEMDQQYDTFDYYSELEPGVTSPIMCEGQSIGDITSTVADVNNSRTTTFSIPCVGGGTQAQVTVLKRLTTTPKTIIYADAYNNCNVNDVQRVERGIQAHY